MNKTIPFVLIAAGAFAIPLAAQNTEPQPLSDDQPLVRQKLVVQFGGPGEEPKVLEFSEQPVAPRASLWIHVSATEVICGVTDFVPGKEPVRFSGNDLCSLPEFFGDDVPQAPGRPAKAKSSGGFEAEVGAMGDGTWSCNMEYIMVGAEVTGCQIDMTINLSGEPPAEDSQSFDVPGELTYNACRWWCFNHWPDTAEEAFLPLYNCSENHDSQGNHAPYHK